MSDRYTILVGGEKGGTGKSMTATNLAIMFKIAGLLGEFSSLLLFILVLLSLVPVPDSAVRVLPFSGGRMSNLGICDISYGDIL